MMHWRRERLFDRPSTVVYTPPNRIGCYAHAFGPFCHAESESLESEETVPGRVAALLATSGPAAVFRTVIFIIVEAIQRIVEGGSWPHILQEVFEAMKPAATDTNTPASPTMEKDVFGIITPPFHSLPGAIFRRSRHAVSTSVAWPSFSRAPTSPGASRPEIGSPDEENASTIALTFPKDHRGLTYRTALPIGQYSQFPKALSRYVNELRHFFPLESMSRFPLSIPQEGNSGK